MNRKIIILLVLVAAAIFLGGCTETTICGDQICSTGEENTCPTDCAEPVNATVQINVSGAWDAEGDLSLYWYHSKDVYANASTNITSRLGDNWFGEQSKNLYISFNDSKSGSKPVGDNRTVSMTFTEPGDYYFEVRSEDYAYRAVSEKITVSESKDYYVSLNMAPSNPALRIKAYDESGNILSGNGKITLNAVESICEYGECNENEWEYDSRKFFSGDELNALFFVYVPKNDYYNEKTRDIHYKIEIEKDGYITQTQYYWPYDKYSEYGVWMQKDVSSETGDLKINIVPGFGTTEEDLLELEGAKVTACGYYSECYYETVGNGSIYFQDLPQDTYYVYKDYDYNYQSSHPPMSFEELKVDVDLDVSYGQVTALRGMGLKISMVDASEQLIPGNEISVLGVCYNGNDVNSCMMNEEPYVLGANPLEMSQVISSEEQAINMSSYSTDVELRYNGQDKWFSYSTRQGYNEFVWMFDSTGVAENVARVVWESAQPFAISDWAYQDNDLLVVLKNSSSETLTFNSLKIDSVYSDTNAINLSSGSTTTLVLPLGNCSAGESYMIDQNLISISYNSANIDGKIQAGVADILGTCS